MEMMSTTMMMMTSGYLDDEEEIIHDSGTSENPWAPKGALLSGIAEALRKAGGTWARDALAVILSPVVPFPWEVVVSGDQWRLRWEPRFDLPLVEFHFQLSSFQPTEPTYVGVFSQDSPPPPSLPLPPLRPPPGVPLATEPLQYLHVK